MQYQPYQPAKITRLCLVFECLGWVLCRGGLSCLVLSSALQQTLSLGTSLKSSESSLRCKLHLPMPILALPPPHPPPLQHSLCLGGVRRPGVVCTPHTQLKRAQPTPGGRPITERCGLIFLSMKQYVPKLTSVCRALRAARRPHQSPTLH